MDLTKYQKEAGVTNLWPRLFTESQVRAVVDAIFDDLGMTNFGTIDRYLDEQTSDLSLVLYHALGMLEEAGEISGKLKKAIRDDKGVITKDRKQALRLEAGDVLWYLSQIASALDSDFSDIAELNLEKLAGRAARGTLHGSGDLR